MISNKFTIFSLSYCLIFIYDCLRCKHQCFTRVILFIMTIFQFIIVYILVINNLNHTAHMWLDRELVKLKDDTKGNILKMSGHI